MSSLTRLLLWTFCFCVCGSLSAATIVVETLLDGELEDLAGNGTCELREAIRASELNQAVDTCAPGDQEDIVDLTGLSGTITLVWWIGADNVTGHLDIKGPGPGQLAINLDGRNFNFRETDVSISGMTFKNGSATDGGNLDFYGASASLLNVRVVNGHGYRGGGVSIWFGSLVVRDSEISENSGTERGGGISGMRADITVQNSTIAKNDTNGTGSAIAIHQGSLRILNSTISNNYQNYGEGWESGIFFDPINDDFYLEVRNSIISNSANLDDYVPGGIVNYRDISTFENWYGRKLVAVIDHSLIDEFSILPSSTKLITVTNSLINEDLDLQDLSLSELGYWGGSTRTFALGEGSVALDFGQSGFTDLLCDQRGLGFPRILQSRLDAGAFESGQDNLFVDGFEAELSGCNSYLGSE